jgi:flagellar biosynthesis protein FliQ
MTDLHMLKALQEFIYYVVMGVCLVTIPVLIVGIIMSIFQAATQINEMTLTFIPKFIVMFGMLFMISPWMMTKLISITHKFIDNLPAYIR